LICLSSISLFEGKLNDYNEIYLENWNEIKAQIWSNFNQWVSKIKMISNAHNEIIMLKEFNSHVKSDDFYKRCEEIVKRNLNNGMKKFKGLIDSFKNEAYSKYLAFEGLTYHIMNNTNNILHPLHNSFPPNIQSILEYDFNYYRKSSKDEDKNLAFYNYIIN